MLTLDGNSIQKIVTNLKLVQITSRAYVRNIAIDFYFDMIQLSTKFKISLMFLNSQFRASYNMGAH